MQKSQQLPLLIYHVCVHHHDVVYIKAPLLLLPEEAVVDAVESESLISLHVRDADDGIVVVVEHA